MAKLVYKIIKPTRIFSAQGIFDLNKNVSQKNLKYLFELGFTKNIAVWEQHSESPKEDS